MPTTALALGPSDEDRYGWPGADPGRIEGVCASIARRLIHARVRRVGFLPAAGAMARGGSVSPLVAAVGAALLPFLAADRAVAVVDSWPTWPWGSAMETTDSGAYRTRPLLGKTRLVEIAPVPCGDPKAATVALGAALEHPPSGVEITVVNLAGYAAPGGLPAAADLVSGVVLLAGRKRTSGGALAHLAHALRRGKILGTVLVD